MTITGPDARPAAPGQAVVDAAMLVLERMGLTPADLLAAPAARPPAPTFAEYIPVVSAWPPGQPAGPRGSGPSAPAPAWPRRPRPARVRLCVRQVR